MDKVEPYCPKVQYPNPFSDCILLLVVPSPPLRIAIVDDEEPVRKALARLLGVAGFVAETFASGLEFLDSLRRAQPQCIILDLHLTGLSGLEVLRKLNKERRSLPCLVITGKDEPGVRDRVMAAGAAAYLRKPLDEETLFAAILSAVRQAAARGHQQESGANSTVK